MGNKISTFYSAKQLAKKLHCSEKQIARFRRNGLLKSIRTSHGYVYRDSDVDLFWDTYSGMDLSNDAKVRTAKLVLQATKKSTSL
ncbi:MAG: MerR family transcriptional regulator [Prevotella sp.]|jgi:hypothetical protein|nr:MerR family transcriptional regulator [Prevotella sp.]